MTTRTLLAARRAAVPILSRIASGLAEARTLLALAAPMTGAALVNMGMSITDTVMMGWMGREALAAGAVVSDVYSIVFYFMAGILSIISPLVARATGAGDADGACRAMRHGFSAAAILAAPAFLTVWYAADFVRLFGVDLAVVSLGRTYAHAMAFTIVPMLFVTVWRNLFDALGRPRVYLAAISAALPLNALANQVLMFGWGPVPAFGLAGAGIASAVVAFALLAGFAMFGVISSDMRRLGLYRAPFRIERATFSEIFGLGLPIGFFTVGEVGIFLLATVVVALFGIEALAAHAITIRLAGVIYAIPTGLSQAATVRVSHAIGRGDRDGLARSVRTARIVGMASGAMILAVLLAGADMLPGLFVAETNGAVAAGVAGLLVLLGLLNLAQGFAGPATAILRGFKETRIPMILCLTGYWLIGMPVAAAGAFHFGYGAYGIWVGLATGVAANALLMNLRLMRRLSRDGVTGRDHRGPTEAVTA